MEDIESIFILIQFHLVDGLLELVALFLDHFLPLLNFFLFFLKLLDFFIDLLFHHLKQVLMLDL